MKIALRPGIAIKHYTLRSLGGHFVMFKILRLLFASRVGLESTRRFALVKTPPKKQRRLKHNGQYWAFKGRFVQFGLLYVVTCIHCTSSRSFLSCVYFCLSPFSLLYTRVQDRFGEMRNENEKEGECGMTAILMAGCEKKEHFVGSGFCSF